MKTKIVKRYHVILLFKWFDFWLGWYFDQKGKSLYICLLPMLPIKVWYTEHQKCPMCGSLMHKIAIDTGDGWLLEWECDDCDYSTEDGYPWPYGEEILTGDELWERGFVVV
jgi:hypothetical protein